MRLRVDPERQNAAADSSEPDARLFEAISPREPTTHHSGRKVGTVELSDSLVLVSHKQLMRKLALRGKAPAALKEAHISYETLQKIKAGQPVSARTFRKIVVQLAAWPELEYAEDLLAEPST